MGGQSLPWLRLGTRLAQASLDPGVMGWDVGDPVQTCSLPIAFLPKSFQPHFRPTLRLSKPPIPTPRLSSPPSSYDEPCSLPNCLSSPPYPIVFRDFMFSWNRGVPTRVFHKPRRHQRIRQKEQKRRLKETQMKPFKHKTPSGISWRRRLTTRPIVFQNRGGKEEEN